MRKIKIKTFDSKIIECDFEVAKMSKFFKIMIEIFDKKYESELEPINFTYIDYLTFKVVKKIIHWMEYHFDDPSSDDDFDDEFKDKRNKDLSYWDNNFISNLDLEFIFDIIAAANYLEIDGLLEVGAKHICNKIKGKTCQEVRDILKITNDFTKEEEEAIHKEIEWIRT